MGWIIALAVLAGFAVLPIGVSAIYNSDGAIVYILAGLVRIKIFPTKKKATKSDKPKTEKKPVPVKEKKPAKSAQKDTKGGSITDFLPILESILELLGKFRKKLRVNRLEMKLILAGDDPADLAENYGRGWAILGNMLPFLERYFVIKKRDLNVECDFVAEKTLIFARLDLTITIGRLISLVVVHGVKILRQFLKIMKARKGGART